jgi:hypothetical protein
MAAASLGRPALLKSSTARMVKLSKNSRVAGTIRSAMMAATVSEAFSSDSKTAIMALRWAGRGISLRMISANTPRVPSEPTISPVRL